MAKRAGESLDGGNLGDDPLSRPIDAHCFLTRLCLFLRALISINIRASYHIIFLTL